MPRYQRAPLFNEYLMDQKTEQICESKKAEVYEIQVVIKNFEDHYL